MFLNTSSTVINAIKKQGPGRLFEVDQWGQHMSTKKTPNTVIQNINLVPKYVNHFLWVKQRGSKFVFKDFWWKWNR